MRWFYLLLAPGLLHAQTYDIVLQRGRLIDPASGLDAVRSVGIVGKSIAAISATPLRGKLVIDATGLVIAPGFIDLHQHEHTPEAYRYKAMDGVTTALELEVGVSPLEPWYAAREGKSLINFGASSGHIPARMSAMKDTGDFLPRDRAGTARATAEEHAATLAGIEKGLGEGGLGLGLGVAYTPAATPSEILDAFFKVAKWKRPAFVHMRYLGSGVPGVIEGLQEVIADAAITGAPLHVVHLNSMALKKTAEALRIIDSARARGLDVTTEAYPYIASETRLESASFEPGWQQARGLSYGDLLWPATGERLTAETFAKYRKQGGSVVIFGNTEEMMRLALAHPAVMIASDGAPTHPRMAGTYARVLGKYVREEKTLTLMDAIRKSSWMPAQRLAAMSPQMRQKGTLRRGADADIAIFDAAHVIDKATFEKPLRYSEGFRYVLVAGRFIVRDGKLLEGVLPGEGIRAK